MIKAFIKYLLPLCIFLLSGMGQLSAHAQKGSAYYASSKNLKGSAYARIGTAQPDLTTSIKSSLFNTKKVKNRLAAAENEREEDELITFKKNAESSDFFTAVFYTQVLEYLFSYQKSFLAFCKQFSYYSSHRWYLLFRVFRI